jgi:hypothetical protein
MPTEAPAAMRRGADLDVLRKAQEVLRTDPARALALTEEDAHRFPSSPLAEEREVIAIDALARLSRVDEARARASQFLVDFPRSAYRLRVQALAPAQRRDEGASRSD